MIRHVVCLTPATPESAATLPGLMEELAALVGGIEGFRACRHGRNIDAEGLSPGVSHLFTCDFDDAAALARYADDPRHKALGARLVAACAPGGIVVYDMDVAS